MTTKTAAAPEAAPTRSAARVLLAGRIATREKACETIAERQAAARRLAVIGETAQALAAQLAGAKAQDAATLARHVLEGSGRVPTLTDESRAKLHARVAEAEAQAEAAIPAMAMVEASVSEAFADFHRASAAVVAVTRPVVEEEMAHLAGQVREMTAALVPLLQRLAGARAYAINAGHTTGDAGEKAALLALGGRLDTVMVELRVDPATPTAGTEQAWEALAQRLTIDPDEVA